MPKANESKSREDRSKAVRCTPSESAVDDEDLERFDGIIEAQRAGKTVPPFWVAKYEAEGGKYWNKFYKRNTVNFFRDRHYLDRLFRELLDRDAAFRDAQEAAAGAAACADDAKADQDVPPHRGPFAATLFEVGCGVGNAFMPLLADFPWLRCFGVEISPRAVELARERPEFDADRTELWAGDLVTDPLPARIAEERADFATLIFVLSAIAPEHHATVLRKVFDSLRPGGVLMFRDYGEYDMTQLRFKSTGYVGDRSYVRGDGTLTYFFTLEELADLVRAAGFELLENVYHRNTLTNVKRKLTMKRVWVHMRARRPVAEGEVAAVPEAGGLSLASSTGE